MPKQLCLTPLILLGLACPGLAQPEEKPAVPLTQSMVDDYCRYVAWRWPQLFARVGTSERLGQMVANDWKNCDTARQEAILADLKWWREVFPRLTPAERDRLIVRNEPPLPAVENLHGRSVEEAQARLKNREAIQRTHLQQWHEARQQEIRAGSHLQASHHELMMTIIDNLRPSGRYEYNPATGRYDRYVPYRR